MMWSILRWRSTRRKRIVSRDTLIPPEELAAFVRRKKFDSPDIYAFAESIGIGPGIVVGRLQRDGVLKWHQGNSFKQFLQENVTPEGS